MATLIPVDRLDLAELAPFARLTEAQLRNRLEPQQGIFIAESPKVIASALDAGCEPVAMLTERRHVEGQAAALVARLGDVPVYVGDGDLLASLTGYRLTRGVLCALRRPSPLSVEAVCQGKSRIAVLDNVVNATNTGAVFRAAAALGFEAVLLTSTCSDPLNRRCVRVSMGTVFQVPWAYLPSSPDERPEAFVAQLHALGFATAALALRPTARHIDDPMLAAEPRLAVLLGTEGDGLDPAVIEACRHVAYIPMQHGVDSLNVAAAAAVAFWQLRRR